MRAIDDVKRFHPIILESHSTEAKQLQSRANAVLAAYNSLVQMQKKPAFRWIGKIFGFFIKHRQISLSNFSTISLSKVSKENVGLLQKKYSHFDRLFNFKEKLLNPLSERETDVFRMKAITLIKQQSGLFPSLRETMQHVHKTPIYVTPQQNQETQITLEQTLTPFPGETIIIRGSFSRPTKGTDSTTPLANSFQLTSESVQTGFPYPLQHNGFALANALIPPHPLREGCIEALTTLLEKKESIAEQFRKKTSLLMKSHLLSLRKIKAANTNKKLFLKLHYKLSLTIAETSQTDTSINKKIIKEFYKWLTTQKNPYLTLSTIQMKINSLYIDKPHLFLVSSWLQQTRKDLSVNHANKRAEVVKAIIEESIASADLLVAKEKTIVKNYMHLMGNIFGKASVNLFLQYFSEILEFAPPKLSHFERALQAASFEQQNLFYEVLHSQRSDEVDLYAQITQSLLQDIAHFQNQHEENKLSKELFQYYERRLS